MSMQNLRPEVAWFAEQMEMALRRNDWKGGWQDETLDRLGKLLSREMDELDAELGFTSMGWYETENADMERVVAEAVDIANFAMMVADNAANRGAP